MHKTCAIWYKIEVIRHLRCLQTSLSTGLSTLLWITDYFKPQKKELQYVRVRRKTKNKK